MACKIVKYAGRQSIVEHSEKHVVCVQWHTLHTVCTRHCAYFAFYSAIRQWKYTPVYFEVLSMHQAVCILCIRQCVHRFADRALTPGLQLGITALLLPLLYLTTDSFYTTKPVQYFPVIRSLAQQRSDGKENVGAWQEIKVYHGDIENPCRGCRKKQLQRTWFIKWNTTFHCKTCWTPACAGEREQGPELAG